MASKRTQLKITGMHCAACANRIERRLQETEGVDTAAVNFATEQATVVFDPSQVTSDDLAQVVVRTGYGVLGADQEDAERAATRR